MELFHLLRAIWNDACVRILRILDFYHQPNHTTSDSFVIFRCHAIPVLPTYLSTSTLRCPKPFLDNSDFQSNITTDSPCCLWRRPVDFQRHSCIANLKLQSKNADDNLLEQGSSYIYKYIGVRCSGSEIRRDIHSLYTVSFRFLPIQ